MPSTLLGPQRFALAPWANELERSALQRMLAVCSRPGVLSLSVGLPANDLLPAAPIADALAKILQEHPDGGLQYAPPSLALKEHVVRLMATRGVHCRPEQVFLTAGVQQGLSLLTRLLVEPGKAVLCERIVYSGFHQAILPVQARVVAVPTDLTSGIAIDDVASALERTRPAFLYVIPDGHNPLGVSISPDKRRALVELARRSQVPLVEDDAYGFLHHNEEAIPCLRSLDDDWVLYLGSFSKVLAPALRVGWMVVPEWLSSRLSALKEASDIDTCTLAQRAIVRYLDGGGLPAHLKQLRHGYAERLAAMTRGLADHFPPGTRWSHPTSGVFLWVELPPTIDTAEMLPAAVERHRVAFIPGSAFAIENPSHGRHGMRLNFSFCAPAAITEAIARLGQAVREASQVGIPQSGARTRRSAARLAAEPAQPAPVLETERLLLRPWQPSDLDDVLRIYSNVEVARFLGKPATTEDDASRILNRATTHHAEHGFGLFAMVEKASARVIGSCGLKHLENGPDIELLYHVARDRWRLGFASEAARTCLQHGFTTLDFDRIVAIVHPLNHASMRVLQKVGMRVCGVGYYYGTDVIVHEALSDASGGAGGSPRQQPKGG